LKIITCGGGSDWDPPTQGRCFLKAFTNYIPLLSTTSGEGGRREGGVADHFADQSTADAHECDDCTESKGIRVAANQFTKKK